MRLFDPLCSAGASWLLPFERVAKGRSKPILDAAGGIRLPIYVPVLALTIGTYLRWVRTARIPFVSAPLALKLLNQNLERHDPTIRIGLGAVNTPRGYAAPSGAYRIIEYCRGASDSAPLLAAVKGPLDTEAGQ